MSRIFRAAGAAVLAIGLPTFAAPIVWDGGTPASSDSSGSFNTGANWDLNRLPENIDSVTLTSVSSGIRTVTVSSAITIGSLSIVQTNNVGTNRLSLEATLGVSLGHGGSIFSRPSNVAGIDKVQLDLNGHELRLSALGASQSSSHNHTLNGTINFNAAGSLISNNSSFNAHSNLNFGGDVNVTADGMVTRQFGGSTTTGDINFNFTSGATLDITAGVFDVVYTGARGDGKALKIAVNTGATATISQGATLSARFMATGSNSNLFSVLIDNDGTVNHAGLIALKGSKLNTMTSGGTVHTIDSTGTWRVDGTDAQIKRMQTNGQTGLVVAPTFYNRGLFVGATANDTLQYVQESFAAQRLALSGQGGTIAPGAGTASAGLSSVGTLTLRNIDVGQDALGGKLAIDVGGTSSGQYDRLILADDTVDSVGAGVLSLIRENDTLAITFVNDFTPGGDFSIPILEYGSVALTNGVGFDFLTINGASQGWHRYVDWGVGVYSIEYGATSANFVFAVPEPGSLTVIALGSVGLLRRRRR